MEKTVTKEEVERVALKHINGVIVDKILNEKLWTLTEQRLHYIREI